MGRRKWIYIIIVSLLLFLTGCGGGSEKKNSNIPKGEPSLYTTRFTIDEKDFLDTSNWQKVSGMSKDAQVNLQKRSDALLLDRGDVTVRSVQSQYRFPTILEKKEVEPFFGKALFIGDDFAGIITGYEQGEIVVRDAKNISEAYEKFDISGSLDRITGSMQRSIRRSLARYDHLNKKPLIVSFSTQKKKTREIQAGEPIVTIQFPKGYTIPLERSLSVNVDCDTSEAMCDGDFNYQKEYEKDFGAKKSFGSVTFTSEGSKVVIGLGAYIRAMYDYNAVNNDTYHFEFKPSLYYKIDLKVSINGTSVKGGDKTFELIKNGLEITIPLHKMVNLVLDVKPEIVLGMKDAPRNKKIEFKASAFSKRTGYARLIYSSSGSSVSKGIEEEAEPLTKEQLSLHLDTNRDKIVAYLFPEVAVRPKLEFVKISKKVNIAYVRNGISVDTKLKGRIDNDWIVENTQLNGSAVEDVYVKSYLYGLVDYKWDVKVGDFSLYESDEWQELYNGEKIGHILKILEWRSQFLQLPTINIQAQNDKRLLSFDIESLYKKQIRFYYTFDQKNIDLKTINDNRDATPYTIWKIGDQPIELDEDRHVYVRAILFTDEIPEKSDTKWVWGMSSSKVADKAAVWIAPVTFDPGSKDFTDTLAVHLRQSQGYGIEVMDRDTKEFQPCGDGDCKHILHQSTTLVARAVKEFEGERYYSATRYNIYHKCPSYEAIGGDGKCVTQCPYLWDITYKETHKRHGPGPALECPKEWIAKGDTDECWYGTGSATMNDVFINPSCDYTMPEDVRKVCQPYLDRGTRYYNADVFYETDGDTSNTDPEETRFEFRGMNGRDYSCQPSGLTEVDFTGESYISALFFMDTAKYDRNIAARKRFEIHDKEGEAGVFIFSPRPYKKGTSPNEDNITKPDDNGTDHPSDKPDNQSDTDEDNGENVDGNLDKSTPKKWYVLWRYSNKVPLSGSMLAKNVQIDCQKTQGSTHPDLGAPCSLEYGSVSYQGALSPDDDDPYGFGQYTKGAIFLANLTLNREGFKTGIAAIGHESIRPDQGSSSLICQFVWKPEYTINLMKGKAFSFDSLPGDSTCHIEYRPCTKELCGTE